MVYKQAIHRVSKTSHRPSVLQSEANIRLKPSFEPNN